MGVTVRPLQGAEVELVQPLATAAFDDLARRTRVDPSPHPPETGEHYREQHHHLARTDPAGCLGAFDDGGDDDGGSSGSGSGGGALRGVALAHVRGSLWGLTLLVVDPAVQSAGTGRALLAAALATAPAGSVRTFFCSPDTRALRAYAVAGLRLLPSLGAAGPLDVSLLGDRTGVMDGDPGRDAERAGVGHLAVDLEQALQARGRFLVSTTQPGCAVVLGPPSAPHVRVLTAADAPTGQRLLRAALAAARESAPVVTTSPLGPQQDWAVAVAVEARLELAARGPVAVGGVAEPLGGTCPPAAVLI